MFHSKHGKSFREDKERLLYNYSIGPPTHMSEHIIGSYNAGIVGSCNALYVSKK